MKIFSEFYLEIDGDVINYMTIDFNMISYTFHFQNSAEEMERKKERIMLLSLQRRQRADEARARAEAAAAARRAREDAAQEVKLARKEEQARRREAILQQYKLKKAIEEAEREVTNCVFYNWSDSR